MNTGKILGACFIVFVIFIGVLMISCILNYVDREELIIESTVDNVDFFDDYMFVTFSNGDSYKVEYPESQLNRFAELDFTVNSTMRIKMVLFDNWWWGVNDDMWEVVEMVKVPLKVGE